MPGDDELFILGYLMGSRQQWRPSGCRPSSGEGETQVVRMPRRLVVRSYALLFALAALGALALTRPDPIDAVAVLRILFAALVLASVAQYLVETVWERRHRPPQPPPPPSGPVR